MRQTTDRVNRRPTAKERLARLGELLDTADERLERGDLARSTEFGSVPRHLREADPEIIGNGAKRKTA